MKKKMLVFLAAGTLALTSNMLVFSQTPELNWSDFEKIAEEKKLDGEFFAFDQIALQMYIPSAFKAAELSEEDKEQGYIAYFTSETNAAVGVQYIPMEQMELDQYAALLKDKLGVTDVENCTVNGLEMISYTNHENKDTTVLSLATERGYIMEFSFLPVTDEAFAETAELMMASIQIAE